MRLSSYIRVALPAPGGESLERVRPHTQQSGTLGKTHPEARVLLARSDPAHRYLVQTPGGRRAGGTYPPGLLVVPQPPLPRQ